MENKRKIFLFNSVIEKVRRSNLRKKMNGIFDNTIPRINKSHSKNRKIKNYHTDYNLKIFPQNYKINTHIYNNFKKIASKNNTMKNKRSIPFKFRSVSEKKNYKPKILKKTLDYPDILSNSSNFYYNNTENNYEMNSLNTLRSPLKNQNHHFHNDVNYIILNKTINSVDFKNKELSNLNAILQNQNRNLRQTVRNLKNKIKQILNDNKILKIKSQESLQEKNQILKKISNLKNEFNINKSMLISELEQKTNTIEKMNGQLIKLYSILGKKDSEMPKNRNINQSNHLKILSDSDFEKNESFDKTELLQQMVELNNKIKFLQFENKKLKKTINLNKEKGGIINEEEHLKNEIKKYKFLYLKIFHEKENMKSLLSMQKENLDEQQKLKNDIIELKTKINILSSENKNLKQNINNLKTNTNNSKIEKDKAKQENDKLQNELKLKENQINDLKNQNENLNKDLAKMKLEIEHKQNQISTLESDIINFKSQIKDLTTNNTNSNTKSDLEVNKLLKQRHKENIDLNNVVLNLKAQISELENEQHNYILQLSKIQELEKELSKAKKENETNFKELKLKQSENIKLVNIIKTKDKQIESLQKQNTPQKINKMDSSLFAKNSGSNTNRSEDLNEKNNKLMEENNKLKEEIKSMKNEQEEGLILTIDNLKEELKDKNLQINSLIKENSILRNYSKRFSEGTLNKVNSKELNDKDKINLYREQIKELKLYHDSDAIQIKALKDDIKECKTKMNAMKTFNGQLKDLNEFVELFNTAMNNYKPKKKEQKDAFNKLIQIMNNMNL